MASFNPAIEDPMVYNYKDPAFKSPLEWSVGPQGRPPHIVCVFCPTRPEVEKPSVHYSQVEYFVINNKGKPNGKPFDGFTPPGNPCDNPGLGVPPFCEYVGGGPDGHVDPVAPVPLPDTLGLLIGAVCVLALITIWKKMDDLEDIR